MKYTDEQRIEKIRSIVDKLLRYVEGNKITREDVAEDETVRWTLTTPLYNKVIPEFKKQIDKL